MKTALWFLLALGAVTILMGAAPWDADLQALNDYDPPTHAEMTAEHATINTNLDAADTANWHYQVDGTPTVGSTMAALVTTLGNTNNLVLDITTTTIKTNHFVTVFNFTFSLSLGGRHG